MKTAELKTKTNEDLKKMASELKEEQFNLRIQKSLGSIENTARIRLVRKDIARIRTMLTQMSRHER